MLVRNLTLSGIRSEHTVRVSTIYQFMTVFNHSDHAITVFPENLTNEREKHYRVPPRIYLTLPLFGAGTVESCQREVVYTVVSEGVSIPSTVIGLTFTEENNNINMPFQDQSIPLPQTIIPPIATPLPREFTPPTYLSIPHNLPVQSVYLANPPIQTVTFANLRYDLIQEQILRTGTLDSGASVTVNANTMHVNRYSLLVNTERETTITVAEAIVTNVLTPAFLTTFTSTVTGANTPFFRVNDTIGNRIRVTLTNGILGTSTYQIGVLGIVS